jgi:hypothetical protein
LLNEPGDFYMNGSKKQRFFASMAEKKRFARWQSEKELRCTHGRKLSEECKECLKPEAYKNRG